MANSNIQKLALNYGIALGVISLLIAVVQYVMGDYSVSSAGGSPVYGIVRFLAGIIIVVIALSKLKSIQGGFMRFGEGFKLGFSIYIYSALIALIFMLLYTLVLEPNYREQAMETAAEQMYEANPDMTDEQVDTALMWTERFSSPWILAIFSILYAAFVGAIVSAIISAIMKKNPPAHQAEADTQTE